MRAAVTVAPGRIELQERPEPLPGPGEALVRVERVGICGSDLHLFHGRHPYASYPRLQGHEIAGTVAAINRGGEPPGGNGAPVAAPPPAVVGERVAIEPLVWCGRCYACRQGRPNCCVNLKVIGAHVDGAFTEFFVVPIRSLYPTGDLDPELAALCEPVSIGVQAVTRGQIGPGETVVVFGAGPIGQAVLLAAVDRGARILVVDRLAKRLEMARHLGAEETAEAGEDLSDRVREWAGDDGPAVTIDAVGAPPVIRACCQLVASAGRVVIIGLSDQEVSLPIIEFTRKEMTILGSRNNAGVFGEAVSLVQRNRDRLRALITHRFPLERLPEAIVFADEHPDEAEKVMIEVSGD
jgi:L-gulonate 5-dehydrogenase